MIIPRLPEAASSIDVTITVNKKLRPYFTKWFQEKSLNGESPEQFALRILKEAAMNDYILEQGSQLTSTQNTEISNDVPVIIGEVSD